MQYNFCYNPFKKQNSSRVFISEQKNSHVTKTEKNSWEQFLFFWAEYFTVLGSRLIF